MLTGLATVMTFLMAAPSQPATPSLARGVRTSGQKRYLVHIKTRMTVPPGGFKQVRVWHALPTPTAWSRTDRMPPLTALSYTPGTARFELENDKRSGHIYFEQNTGLSPGTNLEFTTNFEFFSANRTFDTGSIAATWSQYKNTDFAGSDARVTINPTLAKVADSIKASSDPVSFVKNACDWVSKTLTYDDTVSWPADDVASTLHFRRGHCGHFTNVFKQLCMQAGIPYRAVWGLALDDAASLAAMHKTPENFTYCHTWSEVNFPYSGWVEVDPLHAGDYFSQPAKLVQNNTCFQNCSVWVTENGKPSRMPNWDRNSGKWDFNTTTKVTFEER